MIEQRHVRHVSWKLKSVEQLYSFPNAVSRVWKRDTFIHKCIIIPCRRFHFLFTERDLFSEPRSITGRLRQNRLGCIWMPHILKAICSLKKDDQKKRVESRKMKLLKNAFGSCDNESTQQNFTSMFHYERGKFRELWMARVIYHTRIKKVYQHFKKHSKKNKKKCEKTVKTTLQTLWWI